MAIVLDGSSAAGSVNLGTNGTVSNVAVGGLPDGTVDADSITNSTIATTELNADVNKGLCKAWCNMNGTGTVAIRASYNVSSITDNGTGDYTVNFTTALEDANYASVASCSPSSGPSQRVAVMNFGGQTNSIVAPTTSACRFSTSALAATADPEYVHFAAFR